MGKNEFNIIFGDKTNIGKKAEMIEFLWNLFKNEDDILIPKTLSIGGEFYDKYIFASFKHREELLDDLYQKIEKFFGNKKLVVRSSASCEDSIYFSAAGQYDSFLNIRGKEKIINAIKIILDGFLQENSKIYSTLHNINLENEKMSFLIQEVANVSCSGVLFTANPINKQKQIIIEYTDGLGDKVVSGSFDIKQIVYDKNNAIEVEENSKFYRLVEASTIIEKKLGYSLDIEWGIYHNRIYIFQTRPIIFQKNTLTSLDIIPDQIISSGFVIGRTISSNNNNIDDYKGKIIIQDNKITSKDLPKLMHSCGVILKQGGRTSHIANVIRELNIPCLKFKTDINSHISIVLDAINGKLFQVGKCSSKEMKGFIKKYLDFIHLYKDKFSIESVTKESTKEAVFMDIEFNEILKKLDCLPTVLKKNIYQKIITYDMETKGLFSEKLIVRIKCDEEVQLQVKEIISSDKSEARNELNCFVKFKDLNSAQNFLDNLGLIKTGYQERKIKSYSIEGIVFNFIEWPKTPIYLGIEYNNFDTAKLLCEKLKLDLNKSIAINGKQIFEKYKIDMKEWKF